MTTHGPIDIVVVPDGAPNGYAELKRGSSSELLGGEPVIVVTEATWERLKQASGRAKDLEHLDRYHEHRRRE